VSCEPWIDRLRDFDLDRPGKGLAYVLACSGCADKRSKGRSGRVVTDPRFAGQSFAPSYQAAPAGCRVTALRRFQTLIAAIDTSSAESSFSS
jgi:hypothetical protein